ncbi:MAG: hypothetical protein NTY35_11480 [Planctomycetota bacterium]|nr:hypothetical protein [Planctomycetota bacterium]
MKTGAIAAVACTLLVALVALERGIARRDDGTAPVVERLVPGERLAGRTTAAFTLESNGARLSYLRSKGLWRCREAFGAVCEGEKVESFLGSVLETRGVLVCAGDACVERARLSAPEGLRLALHGSKFLSDPDRDTLVELAFAPASDPAGATFAELSGTRRVLAVDHDPRRFLDAEGRPAPLVDTRVLAGCFAPGFAGFERMFVDQGGRSVELASDPPAEPGAERSWALVEAGTRREALIWRVGGYVSLWVRLRWEGLADPKQAAALGLDPPYATITLAPSTGDPFEVRVSPPDAANRIHVWNRATNVVAWVRAELLPELVPEAADFTRVEGGNPWEKWLAPR